MGRMTSTPAAYSEAGLYEPVQGGVTLGGHEAGNKRAVWLFGLAYESREVAHQVALLHLIVEHSVHGGIARHVGISYEKALLGIIRGKLGAEIG
jgi:hypothetical protein